METLCLSPERVLATRMDRGAQQRTLSKSDFKLGDDCRTKLYYKKQGYRSKSAENDYLAFLAEGGYLIGAVSKLIYPGGVDLDAEIRGEELSYSEMTKRALDRTQELMRLDEVTIYEAAFLSRGRLVRVDVLVKKGDLIDLIEVKSKSQSSKNLKWSSDWAPYFDDLAFQCIVVRSACPGMRVRPSLLTPDKSAVAAIDNLTSLFRLQDHGYSGSFRKIDIQYVGSDELAEQIRTSGILRTWNVEAIIESRLSAVDSRARDYEDWLKNDPLAHPRTQISKKCFGCEYDTSDEQNRNGFRECWKELSTPEPHIRDLYRIGSLGGNTNSTANRLISEGRVHHDDVDEADLLDSRGELGTYATRILIQIQSVRKQEEWFDISPLRAELKSWTYPLHFIDFEASSSPLPYTAGMKPYQTVVFQWSCHTISAPGDEPTHRDFLNTKTSYPAIDFLQSLQEALGGCGTALMWSKYELTQLKSLRDWLLVTDKPTSNGLIEWTSELIASGVHSNLRLVDQHDLVSRHWFHPRMKGRTSLKVALPSALAAAAPGRIDNWLKEANLLDPQTNTRPDDPYRLLPDLGIEGLSVDTDDDDFEGVVDGVSAMRAYQDMVYGKHMNCPLRKQQIESSLRRYCGLDTLAQVIIWEHWRTKCGL